MKRSRGAAVIFCTVLILGSLHVTALSSSHRFWDGEISGSATIEEIADHLKAKGGRMSDEKRIFIAQTIFEESLRYNVDHRLVLAIMKVESDYRPHVVSHAGARGIMQIHPSLARGLAREAGIQYRSAEDLHDVRKNIRLGTHYIALLIELFDDLPTALFAYNVGHHKAIRLLAMDINPHTYYTRRVIAEYEQNT